MIIAFNSLRKRPYCNIYLFLVSNVSSVIYFQQLVIRTDNECCNNSTKPIIPVVDVTLLFLKVYKTRRQQNIHNLNFLSLKKNALITLTFVCVIRDVESWCT